MSHNIKVDIRAAMEKAAQDVMTSQINHLMKKMSPEEQAEYVKKLDTENGIIVTPNEVPEEIDSSWATSQEEKVEIDAMEEKLEISGSV